MKKLNLKKRHEVSQSQILDCQKQLAVSFPESYVEFLILNNGEYPLERNFRKEDDWILNLNFLYCISDSETSSLLYIAQMYYEKFMSKHFLPFGDDGDWIFVISLRDHDFNNVYLYRTDELEDDCLIYLEATFEAFIYKLQTDNESE